MNRNHEKLLIAILAGLVIAGAAAFAIQPALATTHAINAPATISAGNAFIDLRFDPTAASPSVSQVADAATVWVDHCISTGATDWCLINQGAEAGWVNARALKLVFDNVLV